MNNESKLDKDEETFDELFDEELETEEEIEYKLDDDKFAKGFYMFTRKDPLYQLNVDEDVDPDAVKNVEIKEEEVDNEDKG